MSAEVTLTDAERTRVLLAAALRAGYVDMPVLYAAVERIVAARVEQARAEAWDEGHRFTGYKPGRGDNPYREAGPR